MHQWNLISELVIISNSYSFNVSSIFICGRIVIGSCRKKWMRRKIFLLGICVGPPEKLFSDLFFISVPVFVCLTSDHLVEEISRLTGISWDDPKLAASCLFFLVQWCLTPKWWVSVRTSSSGPIWLPTLTSLALLRSCVVMKQHQRKHWVRCPSTVPLVFVSLAHFESFWSSLALSQ